VSDPKPKNGVVKEKKSGRGDDDAHQDVDSHHLLIKRRRLIATAVTALSRSNQLRRIRLTLSSSALIAMESPLGEDLDGTERDVKLAAPGGISTSVRIHLGFHCIPKHVRQLGNAHAGNILVVSVVFMTRRPSLMYSWNIHALRQQEREGSQSLASRKEQFNIVPNHYYVTNMFTVHFVVVVKTEYVFTSCFHSQSVNKATKLSLSPRH